MLVNIKNPKKGDKVTLTREYNFGKGEYTETHTIVSVWGDNLMIDTGEIFKHIYLKTA